jgi:hypothetical protein
MPLQKQRADWLQLLAKKDTIDQYKVVRDCSPDLIKDLHEIITHIACDKNLKISPKYKIFLKKHRTFLGNFIDEQDIKKKKCKLLRQVKGGFLSVLIPSLISLATALFTK